MTDKEAMQMALETLDNMVKVDWREWDEFASVGDFVRWAKSRASFTAEALRARLSQPEPQREWVGLTDEEIDKWNIVGHESLREFVRAIEAKLEEKNGY